MYKKTYQTEQPVKNPNGKLSQLELTKKNIRKKRAEVCFPIINRGTLWYNKLSISQHTELTNWYNAWLDAPETLKIPETPSWVNEKLVEEEIL